jgi:hypothetical protein
MCFELKGMWMEVAVTYFRLPVLSPRFELDISRMYVQDVFLKNLLIIISSGPHENLILRLHVPRLKMFRTVGLHGVTSRKTEFFC